MLSNSNLINQARRYVTAIMDDLYLLQTISNVLNCEGRVADWDHSKIKITTSIPSVTYFNPILNPPVFTYNQFSSTNAYDKVTFDNKLKQYNIDLLNFINIDSSVPFDPTPPILSSPPTKNELDAFTQFQLDVNSVNSQLELFNSNINIINHNPIQFPPNPPDITLYPGGDTNADYIIALQVYEYELQQYNIDYNQITPIVTYLNPTFPSPVAPYDSLNINYYDELETYNNKNTKCIIDRDIYQNIDITLPFDSISIIQGQSDALHQYNIDINSINSQISALGLTSGLFTPILTPPNRPDLKNYRGISDPLYISDNQIYLNYLTQFDEDVANFKNIDLSTFVPLSSKIKDDELIQFTIDINSLQTQIDICKSSQSCVRFIPILSQPVQPDTDTSLFASVQEQTDANRVYQDKLIQYQLNCTPIDIKKPLSDTITPSPIEPLRVNFPDDASYNTAYLTYKNYLEQYSNDIIQIRDQYLNLKQINNEYNLYSQNLINLQNFEVELLNFIEKTSTYKILNSISLLLYQANLNNIIFYDVTQKSNLDTMENYSGNNTINLVNNVSFKLSYLTNTYGSQKNTTIFSASLPDILPVNIKSSNYTDIVTRNIVTPKSFSNGNIINNSTILYNFFNVIIDNRLINGIEYNNLFISNILPLDDSDRIQIINNYIGQFKNFLNTLTSLKHY